MDKRPIKLFYILSNGHSGSTLLDMILNSQDSCQSVGEVLNIYSYLNTFSSYIPDHVSSFWFNIINSYNDSNCGSDINLDDLDLKSPLKRYKLPILLSHILSEYNPASYNSFLEEYALLNYRLFEIILEYTGSNYIIDSSKSGLRLLALQQSPLFDIRIIFVCRDLKSIMNSLKLKSTDILRAKHEWNGPVHFVFKIWKPTFYQNTALLMLPNDIFFATSYKQLSDCSHLIVERLCDFLGINFLPNTLDPTSRQFFSNVPYYGIGGNRMRYNKVKKISYRKHLDALSFADRFIFFLFGGELINILQLFWLRKYSQYLRR